MHGKAGRGGAWLVHSPPPLGDGMSGLILSEFVLRSYHVLLCPGCWDVYGKYR